jgi:alkylglycerol monooxygenase
METYASVLTIAVIVFMVLIVVEWVASIFMKKPVNRAMDTISSLSSGTTNTIKDMLKLSVTIISYQWLHEQFAIFEIQSTFWLFLLAFIGIDFAAYWSHRWNHEFNVLWNRHIVHHSSEEFNLSAALRQSISGIFGIYFFLSLPMAIIGIPPIIIEIVAPLHLFAQFWYHTRLINRMGFLEKIIVTPSHHRVHHAINDEYMDKNYAAIFILWDKWFGTFQEELPDAPPVYGVKKPVKTWNPIIINFMHLWQLIKDAWHAEKLWDKIRIWFMPTGWRPEDVSAKYPIEITKNPYQQVKYNTAAGTLLIIWCWFQLSLHLALEFHLISLLPNLDYLYLLYYGIFLLISIFAYTTLMDRHPLAVTVEGIKMIMGFGLIFYLNGWYGLDASIPYATVLMSIYFMVSFLTTLYFTYFEKSEAKI